MNGHYDKRKKKLHGPVVLGRMKKVRIDARTEIEVSVDISDAQAIERYYTRHKNAVRPPVIATDEEEVEQEELELAVVDDSELEEEE